jgi:hypothetical protein
MKASTSYSAASIMLASLGSFSGSWSATTRHWFRAASGVSCAKMVLIS